MLSLVLYGFEIWSLALEEEYRLRVSENGMLRSLLGLKRKLWQQDAVEKYIRRSFVIFIHRHTFL